MGYAIQQFIIDSGLVGHAEEHPIVFVWSANAADQIGQFVKDNLEVPQ
jgi:hypothetical protein